VVDYAVRLVTSTRPKHNGAPAYVREMVSWGAGPRASQCLVLGAKARAVLDGRPSASVEDVRTVAIPAMRHRIVTNFNAEAEGVGAVDIVRRLLEEIKA
jgi:MoxR-like ATPase